MHRQTGLLLILFYSGLALGQVAPPQAKQITLENSQLRVVLSTQNGSLISVGRKDKDGDVSYLGSSAQSGWFRVELPLPYWEGHVAASKDLSTVRVAKQTSDSVELEATGLTSKEGKYKVTSHLSIRLKGDNIICALALRNDGQ